MNGFDWPRFLADDVLPALFARLDQAFPEFGWVRRRTDTWEATDDRFTHGRFGVRPDRVFAKRGGHGFGWAGGDGQSWVDYVGGPGCRGEAFKAAVVKLAGLAGVPVPNHRDLSDDEKAELERRQAEAAAEAEKRRAEHEAQQAASDEEQRGRALALWEAAEPDSLVLREYFGRVRGIDLSTLKGWPWSIRYGPIFDNAPGHGAICAACDGAGNFRGVQRIGLGPTGEPLRDKHRNKVKAMLGRPRGGAVSLPGERLPDTLILCEGVETGLAIHAATGISVACALSAGFMAAYEPPAQFTRVVIAADCDASGTGQEAAEKAADVLRVGNRKVEVALPGPEHAPGLFEADRSPKGKGVDWLDVYQVTDGLGGPAIIEAAMHAAADAARGAEPNDWGDLKIMPENDLDRARMFLLDEAAPARGQRRHGGLHLAVIAGAVYRWRGGWWQWLPKGGEVLRRDVRRWGADGWHEIKVRRKDGESIPEPKRLCLSKHGVEAIAAAVCDEAMVIVPDGEQIARMWLKPMFDGRGRVQWEQGAHERVDHPEGRPSPASVISLANGLLDVEAWKAGDVRVMPHTPCFFNLTQTPWVLPQLPERVDDDQLVELIDEMCPEWLEFLATKLRSQGDNGEAVRELQKWCGYVLTPDMSRHTGSMMFLVGPPGTGKSTICRVIEHLVGRGNVVHSALHKLTDGPHMASWIGKPMAVFSEANSGTKSDKELASEMLKSLSGGDPISVRRLYEGELPGQQMIARMLFALNEMPDLPDRSKALQRRMLVLDLSVKHGRDDTALLDRLLSPRSMAGVLLWALLGLRYLERDGTFRQPKSGEASLAVFMDNASILDEFIEDYLEFTDEDGDFETSESIYRLYIWWWETVRQRRKETAMGDTQFFRSIHEQLKGHGWSGRRADEQRPRGYTRIRRRAEDMLGYAAAPGPQRD